MHLESLMRMQPPRIALLLVVVSVAILPVQRKKDMGTITILGTTYSHRLRLLNDEVTAAYGKPITFAAISGHTDNAIQQREKDILVSLHPGSEEDNVAHELMHAILESKGYSQILSISTLPLSTALRNLLGSELDHLVINAYLLERGYDAKRGFLLKADRYDAPGGSVDSLLPRAYSSEDPNKRAIALIGTLKELMKFKYYIGSPGAQEYILGKMHVAAPYWQPLDASIAALPRKATPQDVWRVAITLIHEADKVCVDTQATFRASDFIGLFPMLVTKEQLQMPARKFFVLTETNEGNVVLARAFTKLDHIMVGAVGRPASISYDSTNDLDQSVSEFASRYHVRTFLIQ